VLAGRLVWPGEAAKFHHFVKSHFKRPDIGGLENEYIFAKVWGLKRDKVVEEEFKKGIVDRMQIMVQPVLRDVLPSLMNGAQVTSYQLLQDSLTFSLDTVEHLKDCVEYSLDFCTGNITSSRGDGIIHRMYCGVKKFFENQGNINGMADMLAEMGISSKMQFDGDDQEWRFFDEARGVWSHALTKHQPEAVVSAFIEQLLRPLKQLEDFFGRDIVFHDTSSAHQAEEDISDCEATEEEEGANGSGSQVGSKRSRNSCSASSARKIQMQRSMITRALYKYSQTLRNQGEILKVLVHKVIFSFTEAQNQQGPRMCCPNGLVDLVTGQLMGKPSREDFVTEMCRTEFDPNADMQPAIDFYKQMFPLEAYPEQQKIIEFIQMYMGYCLTRETDQQYCLVFHGRGSNGKTNLKQTMHDTVGADFCRVLPFEALAKARGQNNDSLHDARYARVVTVEESNGRGVMNEATFKNLVCGEPMTNKTMYKKEYTFKPVMKLIFILNDLPECFNQGSQFSITRRMVFIHCRTLFLNEANEVDSQQADELRSRGEPECLIQKKVEHYYEDHVKQHVKAFLRFWVEGAKAYFAANRRIQIPASLQRTALGEKLDRRELVREFVTQRLRLSPSGLSTLEEIEGAFRTCARENEIDVTSYTRASFAKDLVDVVRSKRSEAPGSWAHVDSKQRMVKGVRNTYWTGLEISSTDLSPIGSFDPPG
jgi:P4 family phage/plasmid primase-like protien